MRRDKLRTLLDTYREAGVTEVEFDDKLQPKRLSFGPAFPPVPTGDVEGAEDTWKPDAPMGLAEAVARIHKQYAPKQKTQGRAQ